jgi:prepilin-type N-terminal cleavage/methylation domain-containing protein
MHRQRAFTLIELLVAVAIAAIVLLLVAPSVSDYINVKRLQSINAALVTDLQYARSEAVSRNTYLRLVFGSSSAMTCYTLYTLKPGADAGDRCNCLAGPGAACDSMAVEVRTVQVPSSLTVKVLIPSGVDPAFAFDNVTGGLLSIPTDKFPKPKAELTIDTTLDSARTLRTTISGVGRPTVCATAADLGAPAC